MREDCKLESQQDRIDSRREPFVESFSVTNRENIMQPSLYDMNIISEIQSLNIGQNEISSLEPLDYRQDWSNETIATVSQFLPIFNFEIKAL